MSDAINRLPARPAQRIAWLQQRLAGWEAHAAELGFSAAELEELQALLEEAAQQRAEAIKARALARSATQSFYAAVGPFSEKTAAMVARIRARAASIGNIDLLILANIDARQKRTPLPAPEMPSDVRPNLLHDGSIELRWKHTSPAGRGGVTFEIARRLAGEKNYTIISATTRKRLVDDRLPPGTPEVSYRIRALRAGLKSLEAVEAMVYLGSTPIRSAGAERQAA